MEKKGSVIRLIYPQWQGGNIAKWISEIKNPADASRGYFLGARLLDFLAPDNGQEKLVVPVSTEVVERKEKDGILDKDIIIRQTRAALSMLRVSNPDKIVTLGGECSVSVVPFTYLAEKYDNDVAVIWIDAHPDITLPGDVYSGYHAMAVTACKRLLQNFLPGLHHRKYCLSDYVIGSAKRLLFGKNNMEFLILLQKMWLRIAMRSSVG